MMRVALAALALISARAQAPVPCTINIADGAVVLANGYVRAVFNLTRGSLAGLFGRWAGDGDFSASPNVAGAVDALPFFDRRGALAVSRAGTAGGAPDSTTASFDRAAPLAATVVADTPDFAAFSVALGDAAAPLLAVTLTLGVSAAAPRALAVTAVATALADFSAELVELSVLAAPADSVAWYARGVRQGMQMPQGAIASASPLARWYGLGPGSAAGALEARVRAPAPAFSTLWAGEGLRAGGARSGVGLVLWGAPAADDWAAAVGGKPVAVSAGARASAALDLYPNDYAFPPSGALAGARPAGAADADVAAMLSAAHGAAASALHSYDFFPETRASPCLEFRGNPCYGGLFNFYDPDSAISNSAMLWSFDADLHAAVRGQLETNLALVCPAGAPADRCERGQAIHHFTPSCSGPECVCGTSSAGVSDCFVYDAISGAVQTGPNVFTVLSALRYAGASGDVEWLGVWMDTLRAMMGFLDARFHDDVGLYLAPGSLQIDVFIRANYTADTNAAMVLLTELFADAEAALGNATGAAAYAARADAVRAGMNAHLLAASGDHYCTQSDPAPGGGVLQCTRDFVDYDANLLAVAARVPASAAASTRVRARVDGGNCTHAGRATWVSEVHYGKADCVNGNDGDSSVAMGRIAWQDGLARQAVGGAAAAAAFETLVLGPLQADVLARTWLPERFTCAGADTHNNYYFEYPSVVAMLIFEVRYGITLALARVKVDPLSAAAFDFALGGVRITYSRDAFAAQLTRGHAGARDFTVTQMTPGVYTGTGGGAAPRAATVGADGMLLFAAPDVSEAVAAARVA